MISCANYFPQKYDLDEFEAKWDECSMGRDGDSVFSCWPFISGGTLRGWSVCGEGNAAGKGSAAQV